MIPPKYKNLSGTKVTRLPKEIEEEILELVKELDEYKGRIKNDELKFQQLLKDLRLHVMRQ
jgi:hypothetical protein